MRTFNIKLTKEEIDILALTYDTEDGVVSAKEQIIDDIIDQAKKEGLEFNDELRQEVWSDRTFRAN